MPDVSSTTSDMYRVLDALPHAVVAADRSGLIVLANNRCEDVLGWSPSALVGQPITILTPPRLRGAHLEGFERYLVTRVPRIIGIPTHVPALHRDGSEVEVELTLIPVERDDAGLFIVASLSPLALVGKPVTADDEQLRRQLDLTHAITTSLGEGVYALDRSGRVTFMNSAAEELLGWTEHEVLSRNMHEVIHFQSADGTHIPNDACPLLAVARTGITFQTDDDVFTRKDGTLLPVSYTSSPITTDGQIVGTVLAFRDMTERKRAEAERERATGELEEAKNAFLSSAAHDLRTPLTTIKSLAQILDRRASTENVVDAEQVRSAAARIAGTSNRMAAMIDELLDASHIQMGQPLELWRRPTDLEEMLNRVVADQEIAVRNHHVEIHASDSDVVGNWDTDRLERVFSNLLSNAIKYTPIDGRIRISVAREQSVGTDAALVSIVDNGLGIPANDVPHIFERFRRGGNVGKSVTGAGIGLAGARQIVELHGGRITVESQEGEGSTFTVWLPLNSE